MMTFANMDEVRQAVPIWFSSGTMQFFKSRVGAELYGGRYFVSSERPPGGTRRYSVREVTDTTLDPTIARSAHIQTIGVFGGYETASQAEAKIKRLLKGQHAAGGKP